jgi:peptidyl-prolyl cis-trans isomerase C
MKGIKMFTKVNRFVLFISVLFLIFAVAFVGCGKKDKVVAKVGKLTIKQSEFKDAFVARYRAELNAQKQSFSERMDFLNSMIDQKLMLADAYKRGLDKNEEVTKAKSESQERIAVQQILYEREIIDKIITEADVKEFYDKSGKEVHVRHILVRIANPEDTVEAQKALARADSIYQAIQKGADFQETAKLLSDDKSNSPNGGDLGFLGWGRTVEEFQNAAFALNAGEISKPVKTMFGYHIIQCVESRDATKNPYDDAEKENIKGQLRNMRMDKLRATANAYIDTLKAQKKLEYKSDSLAYVFKKISEPNNPQNVSLFGNFTAPEKEIVVATYTGGKVTVKDLDEKIGSRGAGSFTSGDDFKQVIDGIVIPKLLADRAKELGLMDDPEAVKAGQQAMESKMVQMARSQEIDDKLSFDDKTLQEYYNKNMSKYMTEAQVTIREIMVDDMNTAESLLAKAKKGANFKQLARKYTTRAAAKSTDGLLGPFGKNRYGKIGREAHQLEKGQFCEQPVRMGKKYSIFRVEDKIPAVQKTYEESKNEVERDYRNEMRKNLEETWIKKLHEDFKVKVYEENLRKALPFAAEANAGEGQPGNPQKVRDNGGQLQPMTPPPGADPRQAAPSQTPQH